MVDWIGKFFFLLKRLKDSWMDLSPLSALTQQQRKSQSQADMTQLNAERRSRSEADLDPSQQGTGDNWYATHVTSHGSLFPFNDNLTTFMFIVASDLNDAQRERERSSLSLRRMSLLTPLTQCKHFLWVYSVRRKAPWRILLSACVATAAVQAQSSSSKTILKMSMDNGPLTKQVAKKAKLIMKDRVFKHGTTTSMLGSPESFRIAKSRKEKL